MKAAQPFLLLLAAVLYFAAASPAQERTTEKRIVKDSTGREVVTESVIVSQTEDITPRHHMITVNPLKFFLFYNLSYYQRVSDNIALGGGLQIPTPHDVSGFGVSAELRFYPSARTLRGFYIAPNIAYTTMTSEGETYAPLSIGALVGWQWFPGDDFAIGLGIGADYYMVGSGTSDGFSDYEGFVPALRFDIGYAW